MISFPKPPSWMKRKYAAPRTRRIMTAKMKQPILAVFFEQMRICFPSYLHLGQGNAASSRNSAPQEGHVIISGPSDIGKTLNPKTHSDKRNGSRSKMTNNERQTNLTISGERQEAAQAPVEGEAVPVEGGYE